MRPSALLIILGVLPASAFAQNYEGPRLLGAADAQRATVNANDSMYSNPAGIALSNWYSVEAGWEDDFKDGERKFNGSIVDSHEKRITGGVGYTFRRYRVLDLPDPAAEEYGTVHRIDLAVASRLGDGFAAGINVHYLNVKHAINGMNLDGTGFDLFTFDAGLQFRHPSGFAAGVAGYNLTANPRPEVPLSVGGGVAYGGEMFTLEFDVLHNTQTAKARISWMGSLLLGGTVVLRAGGAYDFLTENAGFSAGIGFVTPQFSGDFGFRTSFKSGVAAPGLSTERVFGIALRGVPFM
ncbi:MAG: hypothetical protein U1E65_17880 [Myxococcota bacterium]